MANQLPIQSLTRGKRPLWMTALILAGVVAVWFAQQKGWIKGTSGSGGPGAGTTSSTRTGEPSHTAARPDAPAPRAEPRPTQPAAPSTSASNDDDTEDNSSLTAAERAGKPPVKTSDIDDLFKQQRDAVWVEGALKVRKLLADDDDPPRHQRFLTDTPDGHSVMVAHNIDLSDRVPLEAGDTIEVRGEYVWTEQGGKVHFTHAPQYGKFNGGWIKAGGKKYE
jgi:hypothetical protein